MMRVLLCACLIALVGCKNQAEKLTSSEPLEKQVPERLREQPVSNEVSKGAVQMLIRTLNRSESIVESEILQIGKIGAGYKGIFPKKSSVIRLSNGEDLVLNKKYLVELRLNPENVQQGALTKIIEEISE